MILTEGESISPLFDDSAYSAVSFNPVDSASYAVAFKLGNETKANSVSNAIREVYTSGIFKNNFYNTLSQNGFSNEAIDELWQVYDENWLLK